MRIFFLLVLLVGLVLGIAYPWAARNLPANEVATLELTRADARFGPAETALAPEDAPVGVYVEMTAGRFQPAEGAGVLALTVTAEGREVLVETLDFAGEAPRQTSPQAAEETYRQLAGVIDPVEEGAYVFTVAPADAEALEISAIRVVLRSAALSLDPRAPPIGYALIALGFIGFVLALMRGRTPKNPNSSPPPPKWGRQ